MKHFESQLFVWLVLPDVADRLLLYVHNPCYSRMRISTYEILKWNNCKDHILSPCENSTNRVLHHFVYFLGTDDEYEIGDLSGKYGTFLNLTDYSEQHEDYNLPLFGRYSIQGRSLVIHKLKKDGNMRWVCNNLMPVYDAGTLYFMKASANFTGPTLSGMILMVSWHNNDFTSICSTVNHYFKHSILALQGSNGNDDGDSNEKIKYFW